MPQVAEIRVRIPSLRVRREGKDAMEAIDNNHIRFSKRVEVESIPKAGVILNMTVSSGETLECEVVRADWHDDKQMFVIACRYSKRSIPHAEYQALIDSADWQVRPLL